MNDITAAIRRITYLETELAKPATQENILPRAILFIPQLAELQEWVARQQQGGEGRSGQI